MGALWIFAPKQPLSFLLTSTSSSTIHAPYSWLFMLGLLQAAWTYTGYDASAHVAEETLDPRRRAPWGIVLSVVVSGFFGCLLILSLTWAIPSVSSVLNAKDSAGNSLPAVLAIVTATLGQRAGKAVLLLAVAAMWFCGLSTVTSVSRVIYALARDKGLPMAKFWSKTHPQHKTPGAAIWLSVAVAFLALVYSASYSVVTSLSVLGCYLAYNIPVYLGWRRKLEWVDKRGPWHLGQRSNLINVLALVWTVFICAIMIMPPNALAGISMAVVLAVLYALHRFTGPHEIRKPTWVVAEAPATPDSQL
jgi:amino acid transporter